MKSLTYPELDKMKTLTEVKDFAEQREKDRLEEEKRK